jgi:hypothetical protein
MSNDDHKNCPYCDEPIKLKAVKCKHCHSMLIVDNVEKSMINQSSNNLQNDNKKLRDGDEAEGDTIDWFLGLSLIVFIGFALVWLVVFSML